MMRVIFDVLPYLLLLGLMALVVACLPSKRAQHRFVRGRAPQCYRWDDDRTHHD